MKNTIKRKKISYVTFSLVIFIAIFVFSYTYNFLRQQTQDKQNNRKELLVKNQVTRTAMIFSLTNSKKIIAKPKDIQEKDMGLGFFTPNYYEFPVLYFYYGVNIEKTVNEHAPLDSVVFNKQDGHKISTSYAPPWLYPEHLGLDGELLMSFKVLGLTDGFIKVEVNKTTGQEAYIDESKGIFKTWPEFLRTSVSLELIDKETQAIYTAPFNHASKIQIDFKWMQPLLIEGSWMYVKLLNENHKDQGKGWVQWRDCERLLVTYSLLE